jgi:hypothetical protein
LIVDIIDRRLQKQAETTGAFVHKRLCSYSVACLFYKQAAPAGLHKPIQHYINAPSCLFECPCLLLKAVPN